MSDWLADRRTEATAERILDAAEELSEILGRPVDLISRRAVHPLLRERIETEAQALCAA